MSVKWKICENCGKKVNEVAVKCPYCGSILFKQLPIINDSNSKNNSIKNNHNLKSHDKKNELKTCSTCGLTVSKELAECPYCYSTSFDDLLSDDSEGNSISNINKKSLLYKWKYCRDCGANIDIHYSKCPMCNSNSLKLIESNHKINYITSLKYIKNNSSLLRICPNCGKQMNKNIYECPDCHKLVVESKKIEPTFHNPKWYFCLNCGENVDDGYSKCPYCNSDSLTIIGSTNRSPIFSPLMKNVDDSEKWWKVCSECGKKVNKAVYRCPFCHSFEFENEKNSVNIDKSDINVEFVQGLSENMSEMSVDKESAILLVLKHKLFYKKYEGEDLYIFSTIKFVIVLVFVLLFIFLVLCSFDFVTSLIWLVIFIFPLYLLACFEHDESKINSELIGSRKGNISNNVIHFICYWYEEEDNIFVFSKTKAISFLIYIIVFIYQYYATNSLIFAWIIGLILFVVALFGGTIIHGALYAEKSSKELNKQEKKVNKIQKEKIVSKQKTITNKQYTNESEVLKPKVKLPLIKYKYETDKLSSKFELKQKKAREIIEKRFEPPQMTYNKFINVVDSSCELFENQVETIITIINSSTEPSLEVEEELKSKINILNELIEKIDSLTNELLLSISEYNNQNVENVLDELELLKDSVKDYR